MNPYGLTLHHCHGGSVKAEGWHVGMGQKQNPFLQIPLNSDYHVGDMGIDRMGVETWEEIFGTQMEHLKWVSAQLGYDIFREAAKWEQTNRSKSLPSTGTRRSTGEE